MSVERCAAVHLGSSGWAHLAGLIWLGSSGWAHLDRYFGDWMAPKMNKMKMTKESESEKWFDEKLEIM